MEVISGASKYTKGGSFYDKYNRSRHCCRSCWCWWSTYHGEVKGIKIKPKVKESGYPNYALFSFSKRFIKFDKKLSKNIIFIHWIITKVQMIIKKDRFSEEKTVYNFFI
jgi:hypothetical protein